MGAEVTTKITWLQMKEVAEKNKWTTPNELRTLAKASRHWDGAEGGDGCQQAQPIAIKFHHNRHGNRHSLIIMPEREKDNDECPVHQFDGREEVVFDERFTQYVIEFLDIIEKAGQDIAELNLDEYWLTVWMFTHPCCCDNCHIPM